MRKAESRLANKFLKPPVSLRDTGGFWYNRPMTLQTKFAQIGIFFLLLTLVPTLALAETPEEKEIRESALRKELAQVEADIAANTKKLQAKQGEASSISRDIQILTYKINQAKLKIRQKQIEIERLGGDITKRENTITTLSNKIESEKESLAELLRKTKELDHVDMSEVILGQDSLSGFFADLDSFNFIQASMHGSFQVMRDTQVETTKEKVTLERRRDAERDAKRVIEEETKKIQAAEAEQKRLLALTKQAAASYQGIIAEREARRAAIRSALFKLRDTTSISFGEAVDMAIQLSKKTGVRPAFALAILKQETNIGQNVGTCN
ncbi:MAG: hypothetical protein QG665_87, partial [Patescibacteria group bacterium]|nr:hypothetical protein [Patescibacteria group bacterium]